jgi:hypothetical protein
MTGTNSATPSRPTASDEPVSSYAWNGTATNVAIEPASEMVCPRTSRPKSRGRRSSRASIATLPTARRHADAVSGISGTGAPTAAS